MVLKISSTGWRITGEALGVESSGPQRSVRKMKRGIESKLPKKLILGELTEKIAGMKSRKAAKLGGSQHSGLFS